MKKVTMLYLSQEDIMALGIGMEHIIPAVEQAFREHGNKTLEMPPKPGIHTRKDTFIHAMPAYLKESDVCGIKWVSGYPSNYKHDLPQILGVLIVNDCETGVPLSVMDCRWITAMRTAAVTAVSAKWLARKTSKVMGLVGCGVQGRFNVSALKMVLPGLEVLRAYDVRPEQVESLCKWLKSRGVGIEVHSVDSVQKAVEGADVILTATQRIPEPLVRNEWFGRGAFGAGLEASRAWYPDAILTADKFVTDDWEQTKHFAAYGAFAGGLPTLYAELGEIVTGRKRGRASDEERILAINIGVAATDIAIAALVYRKALEAGIDRRLGLMESDL